jgi:hypothetical protein
MPATKFCFPESVHRACLFVPSHSLVKRCAEAVDINAAKVVMFRLKLHNKGF